MCALDQPQKRNGRFHRLLVIRYVGNSSLSRRTGQSKREKTNRRVTHKRFQQLATFFADTNTLEYGNNILGVLDFRGEGILKMVENSEDQVGIEYGGWRRHIWNRTLDTGFCTVYTDKTSVVELWRGPSKVLKREALGQAPLTIPSHFTSTHKNQLPAVLE